MADCITITVDRISLSSAMNCISFRIDELMRRQAEIGADSSGAKQLEFTIAMYGEAYNDLLDAMP